VVRIDWNLCGLASYREESFQVVSFLSLQLDSRAKQIAYSKSAQKTALKRLSFFKNHFSQNTHAYSAQPFSSENLSLGKYRCEFFVKNTFWKKISVLMQFFCADFEYAICFALESSCNDKNDTTWKLSSPTLKKNKELCRTPKKGSGDFSKLPFVSKVSKKGKKNRQNL
jgi:hypothetical protein